MMEAGARRHPEGDPGTLGELMPFHKYQRILAALAALAALGCGRSGHAPAAVASFTRVEGGLWVPEGSPLRKSLQVQTALEGAVEEGLTVPATVEADPAELVRILTPVAGRVVQLHVRLGDWAAKGQPLATLESADLSQAFADFQKASAQYRQSMKALERTRELGRHDIASRKEVEQAEAEFTSNESEWRRARAHLVQLGASPEGADSHLLTLRAPISGRVSELGAGTGGFWNDLNAPLMTLANLSRVWLAATVQEKDISRVYVGQEALAALAGVPGEAFHGRVAFMGEMLDPDTRTLKVRVPLENPGHRLLPAMFANVTFSVRPRRGLLVPTTALVQVQEGSRIFVETAPWTFASRLVKTGVQTVAGTEILDGLKAGERLVTREGVLLND